MATRRAIRGVLGNFLGTYMSRYSDYRGYWLFGYLVGNLAEMNINLLAPLTSEEDNPSNAAVRLALAKFNDQVNKAGLECSHVREAWLSIRRSAQMVKGSVNSRVTLGYNVNFHIRTVMDDGRKYERERSVFVARHDPLNERRSTRLGTSWRLSVILWHR